MENKRLIYGKDSTERIVSIEPLDGAVEIFTEDLNGTISSEVRPAKYWLLYTKELNRKFERLKGSLAYKWLMEYESPNRWDEIRRNSYKKRYDFYSTQNLKTNYMLRSGVTYFKGMQVEDVSILSFDIETTGLDPNAPDAKVLLISNAFRKRGKTVKRLFSVEDYESDVEMIQAWCKWVRKIDPSVIVGHYILGFDFPYLNSRTTLRIGRDNSQLSISDRVRQFRKDGSQTYDYQDVTIYGREVIDTKFLSIKFDVKREFPNYSLKPIIRYLGLEKEDRAFVDAARIGDYYRNRHKDPETWERVKSYALDDSEDSLKLWDKMISSFFYLSQVVPMPLQEIINTATGTQLNNFMIRAYLQDGHSIPKADNVQRYPGAISLGVPGIHPNTLKLDIKANYPNIMLQFDVFPHHKDPKGYGREALTYFLESRLKYREQFKNTGEKRFEDLSDLGKVVANSFYGFMGAKGANFNYLDGAAKVTAIGRDILQSAIYWATGQEIRLDEVSRDTENEDVQAS